jgi:crotonobetainyl-CoA:carnitine CoA-transferase CaiB-like acyl-CoA transferase
MLPLAGVRIVAVEQYGAAPFGTLQLASLGADVIKVESPREGGDVSRAVGPHFVPDVDPSIASLFFQGFNHNKKSITLDLRQEEGREILQRLLAGADALVSNLRGDVPERLGLTYAQLQSCNPRLVCAHLTAYGREGSRASWPGYDYLMQAEAGYFDLTGEPDGPPTRFGLSVVDYMTGLALALGVTAALFGARQTGRGRDVDVSLFDVALYNLNYVATWFLNTGVGSSRAPRSAHLSLAPCQLCRTADGFIYIMCNKEKFWLELCEGLGHPEWKHDVRFNSYRVRLEHRTELTTLLDLAFSALDTDTWLVRLAGKVPCAPVYDVAQALTNPFVEHTGRIMQVPVTGEAAVRVLRPPIHCGEPQPAPTPAPRLGEQTEEILRSLGYDEATIGNLRQRVVI